MTLAPRFLNWVRTSSPTPWPIDTMVMTAEMPMTTPRIVRSERSLFSLSERSEMSMRSMRFIFDFVRCAPLGNQFNPVSCCGILLFVANGHDGVGIFGRNRQTLLNEQLDMVLH